MTCYYDTINPKYNICNTRCNTNNSTIYQLGI